MLQHFGFVVLFVQQDVFSQCVQRRDGVDGSPDGVVQTVGVDTLETAAEMTRVVVVVDNPAVAFDPAGREGCSAFVAVDGSPQQERVVCGFRQSVSVVGAVASGASQQCLRFVEQVGRDNRLVGVFADEFAVQVEVAEIVRVGEDVAQERVGAEWTLVA
ncbi:MAG: hypothetical protein N2554_10030 [Fimbriimonadales bacterium]|nr:hypothetical protein [Fimbriimonadales bacterium]